MQEEFLHYLWQFQKFDFTRAITSDGETLEILETGSHNLYSGPDFFNAKIRISNQVWAGNIEIHLKSSHWYAHAHELDPNYDSVILHVVWENDVSVFRKDNSKIPCLALKNLVHPATLANYQNLLEKKHLWINCENDFKNFNKFEIDHWLERLYFEKLEEKTKLILNLLEKSENNWEAVLFKMLARSFGLNVNGEAFLSMASSFNFNLLAKNQKLTSLEALLFGQAGLLNADFKDNYEKQLYEEYQFLKHKNNLQNEHLIPPKYFRLRPDNFPNIRLAQLAAVYTKHTALFSKITKLNTKEELYDFFEVDIAPYWQTHYNFDKEHKPRNKKLSKAFIDLLIINCLIPMRFSFASRMGEEQNLELLNLISSLPPEHNAIIKKFNGLRKNTASTALDSQALIRLKSHYCDKNRCLKCELGVQLLQRA